MVATLTPETTTMNATKLALASLMLTCLMPFANAQDDATETSTTDATRTATVEPGDQTSRQQQARLEVYLRELDGGVKIETRRPDKRPSDGFIVVCVESQERLWPIAVLKAQDALGTTIKVRRQVLEDLPLVLIAVEYRDDGTLECSAARRMGELLAKIEK